ncbi:MAG: hypothetical protein ABJZ55_13040 [Fuerstiella sp.]
MMEDLLPAMAWLTCTWLVIRWSFDIAHRAFPADRQSELVLHVGVISVSMVVLGLTVLGAVGAISPWLGLLAPLAFILVLKKLAEKHFTEGDSISWNRFSLSPRACFWFVVIAGLTGHSIVNGVMQFPRDWDNLMYHMPFVDHWIQTGSLAATETPRWSDPANSEVLGLWFAVAFSGDFLVALNNIPTVIVWIVAMLCVARGLGLNGWWPHLVALGSISVSVTLRQTVDASNDLMVPAFFFASVAYAVRYYRSSRSGDLILFGVTLGLLAGLKFFATGYGLVTGLAFALMCWNRLGVKSAALRSIQAVGISLLFGGYWFGRNFWMTGHIFYPQGSEDLHRRIPHPNLPQTTLAWNGDERVAGLAMDAVWEHCGVFHWLLLTILPSLLLWQLWTIWRNHAGLRVINGLLLFLLGSTFLLAVNTPMLVEDQPDTLNHLRWGYTPVRYTLTFLSVGVLTVITVAAQLVANASNRAVGGLQMVLLMILGIQLWTQFSGLRRSVAPDWIGVGIAGEFLAIAGIATFYSYRCRRIFGHILLFCLIGLGSHMICSQSQHWHAGFARFYDKFYVTQYFSQSGTEGARMLVLDYRSYPFFGSRRQNFIIQPMDFQSSEEVLDIMKQQKLSTAVTLVESRKEVSRYRPVWEKLEEHPSFELLEQGRALRVFRLK